MVRYTTAFRRNDNEPFLQVAAVRDVGGEKVHLMSVGSSVTTCGLWTGRSALVEVDQEITCKRCLKYAPGWTEKIKDALKVV